MRELIVPCTAALIAFVELRLAGNETMLVTSLDANGVLHHHSPLEVQLQATFNIPPAYAWYAQPSGALTFVSERPADCLGLPRNLKGGYPDRPAPPPS